MKHPLFLARCVLALACAATLPALAQDAVDMGQTVPNAKTVTEGLFPEDDCEQLKAAGFKCMGFKPAVRYSLPASSFKLGSADLPDSLKRQLEVFAEVLKAKWQRQGGARRGPCRRLGCGHCKHAVVAKARRRGA